MRLSDEADEVLQALYCMAEDGDGPFPKADVLARAHVGGDALPRLLESALVTEDAGRLALSDAGREQATKIVRRHRLAERLLHDVLRIDNEAGEPTACRFEHVLEGEVTESICTLLGHPRVCPHGKPIPPGPCCTNGDTSVPAVIQRLSDTGAGGRGVVAYVHAATDERIDRLASFGLVPGTEVTVHQTWPSVVVEFGETHLALDRETADEIFVRVVPCERPESGDWSRGRGPRRRRRFWRRQQE